MISPILIASTDVDRRVVVMTATGPMTAPADVESLRTVMHAVPDGYGMIVDLSGVDELGDSSLATLCSIADEAADAGIAMIVVCADGTHRTAMISAGVMSVAPIVNAIEHAFPLTHHMA